MNEDDLFGPELVEAWEQSGLSKAAYARELNIPRTTLISRFEAVGRKPGRPQGARNARVTEDNETVLTTRWVESLDELFEIFQVDLEVWHPYRHVVNYWGSPTHPNTQVKAWLDRIKPVAIEPVVSPLIMKLPKPRKVVVPKRTCLRLLNVPDAHVGFRRNFDTGELIPFHDRRALDLIVQVAEIEQPDVIVVKGDWMDMTEWTDKYLRSPEYFMTTQPSAIEGAWWLAQLRIACPNATIVYLKGNHENRLDNIMASHLAYAHKMRKGTEVASHPLYSMYTWLDFEAMDIQYVDQYPGGQYWVNPRLALMHGDICRTKPGKTAQAIADKEQYSVGFDHIHRHELATRKVRTPQGYYYVYAFASGCLCHIDGRVPGSKVDQNWAQGFSMVDYLPDGTHSTPQFYAIYEGETYYNGAALKARDRLDELVKATSYVGFI